MTHYCIKYRIQENYDSDICVCINADGMKDLFRRIGNLVSNSLQDIDQIKEITIVESQVVKN